MIPEKIRDLANDALDMVIRKQPENKTARYVLYELQRGKWYAISDLTYHLERCRFLAEVRTLMDAVNELAPDWPSFKA